MINLSLVLKSGTIAVTKLVGYTVIQTAVDKALRKLEALKNTPELQEVLNRWSKMTREEKLKEVGKWLGVTAISAFVAAAVMTIVADYIDEAWELDEEGLFVESEEDSPFIEEV